MTKSEIARLYANCTFNFLRNLHTGFHSDCISVDSHQQCRMVALSPSPQQHLLSVFCFFLVKVTLTGVRCYLSGLSCISLMISDVEHLIMGLLAICMSSLEIYLFRTSADFLDYLAFLYWVLWVPYIYWILTPYWTYHLQYLLPFSRLPFSFVDSFLHCAKAL